MHVVSEDCKCNSKITIRQCPVTSFNVVYKIYSTMWVLCLSSTTMILWKHILMTFLTKMEFPRLSYKLFYCIFQFCSCFFQHRTSFVHGFPTHNLKLTEPSLVTGLPYLLLRWRMVFREHHDVLLRAFPKGRGSLWAKDKIKDIKRSFLWRSEVFLIAHSFSVRGYLEKRVRSTGSRETF